MGEAQQLGKDLRPGLVRAEALKFGKRLLLVITKGWVCGVAEKDSD
jgi:hypothetical protein